jgi:hypothetical protein
VRPPARTVRREMLVVIVIPVRERLGGLEGREKLMR